MMNRLCKLINLTKTGLLIILSFVIVFVPTFFRLATIGWKSANYTHAYFILPISLFLIWLKRKDIVETEEVSTSGIILFVIGILIYLFSSISAFMFLEAISFVVVMWAVFKLRVTKESFKHLVFPLTYLVFLIPPPRIVIDLITFPLKHISAVYSFHLLKLLNLPVELRGVILQVADNEMFIADACSGFRSIVTLLSLGAVFAYFQDATNKKKWIIFLSVVPLAIFANVTRISLTGILSYNYGSKFAEGFFHQFSGIVLFVITVFGLIGLTGLVCKKHK